MKISFSTVGCPQWTWGEIVAAAKDIGYDGIELRGLGDDLFMPQIKMFRPENLGKTREELGRAGVSICCLASDVYLHEGGDEVLDAMRGYVDLASALSVPCIRVLGDSWGQPGEGVDTALVARRLKALASDAAGAKVMLLLESNGVFADTAALRRVLDEVASPAVQALWDINHPFRFFGEDVETTWRNIGPYVRHVHLKDSVMDGGRVVYKMLGHGDLPVRPALGKLKAGGYDGYLSLEWTKRWNDDLEDAGVAFSYFAYMVRKLWNEA